MFLKTLELHGFKSFPEKTVLHFDAGATVIVGPNGSGKSNITDAMRWVLGELSSKNMRGSKMEDVIFIGTDDRRPMSFAEVSVTFDNTDEENRLNSPYDEITVTRRYYRSGDSEYYINRKPVRLRDIYELFMNTGIGREGYSIVGQGKIAEIISKKGEDRRGIFEETAGISKFRYRKQESEKKLHETEDNMSRVADIVYELERQLPPLERDSKKARQYLELFEEKKKLEVSLWLYDIDKINDDLDKTKKDCELSAHEYEMAADTEAQLEAQNDRIYSASVDNKANAEKTYEQIKALRDELHAGESELTKIAAESARARTNLENTANAEIAAASAKEQEKERIAKLNEAIAELGEKATICDEEAEKLKSERAETADKRAENEAYLEDKLSSLRSAESELNDLRVRMDVLKNTLSDNTGKSESISADIGKYTAELESIKADVEYSSENIAQYKSTLDECDKSIAEIEKQTAEAEQKNDRIKNEIASITAERSAADGRLNALKRMLEHFDGYNNSVRFVMSEKQKGTLRGIHAPISHIIKANDENVIAVETALGSAMQNIVVDDEAAAKSAIYALKNAGAGRATFYPLTSVKSQGRTRELDEAARCRGFIGFANELVECERVYSDVIASILGRVAVFDNIDSATDAARMSGWKIRAVTLDGQQINAGGSFTGGSVRHESGMLTRNNQINKLNDDISALDKKAESAQKKLDENDALISQLRSRKRLDDERKKLTETLLASEQGLLSELDARRGVAENLLAQLGDDASKLDAFRLDGDKNIAALDSEKTELEKRISAIAEERAAADVVRHELEDALERSAELISEKAIERAGIDKDIEVSREAITEAENKIASLDAEADDLAAKKDELAALLAGFDETTDGIEKRKTEIEAEINELEAEREKLEAGGLDYEKRLNEIRGKLRDISAKKEIVYKANAKNEAKRDQLTAEIDKMVTHLWDEYELTNTTAAELGYPELTAEERPAASARFGELKASVKALGHVNLDSIEQYAETKERYDSIKIQMDDLQKSKEELEKIIGEIEADMKRIFMDAFERIDRNFSQVFKELFGGGHAHLSLTDPENVLTSGIEISAAPPGKMIKNLSLLSGGEQSVVAIALLFALIKVNPSPFCIFDEIEAALDEVNVSRVAKYISRYSRDMQIIMITHRRGTMEIADTLYGVTMPHRGVSKVFSLDVGTLSDDAKINDLVE